MKKIGLIGAYDKTDFILYIAKILSILGKSVIVIDTTMNQKAKYVVPVINPTRTYLTEYETIDVAVGFKKMQEMRDYLGLQDGEELQYDYALIDIDSPEAFDDFNMQEATSSFFVTSFDLYSLKRGLEILSGITEILNLTKVCFSKTATKEDDDYLNYLALGYKIQWSDEIIYFPFEVGDQSVIAENQRVAKIKFKKLSAQYKEALIFIVEQILDQDEYAKMKRIFKQLEKGV